MTQFGTAPEAAPVALPEDPPLPADGKADPLLPEAAGPEPIEASADPEPAPLAPEIDPFPKPPADGPDTG